MRDERRELLDAYNLLMEKESFEPGDIVDWKAGFKNKAMDGPFIVTKVYDEPIINLNEESGSAYYREPLDIVLGSILDGILVEYHYDSRRLQKVRL